MPADAGKGSRFVVTGRVHPERTDVHFNPVVWQFSGGGTASISCDASQLTVLLDDMPSIDGFIAAHIAAEQFSQAVVGALGFALGTGYTVEMIQVVEETGKAWVIGTRPPGLGYESHDPIFVRARNMAHRDVYFRFALRDYMQAITEVFDCAVLCFRAIEGLRSSFGSDKQGGWSAMHAALGTSRAEIDTRIKLFADASRHANWNDFRTSSAEDRFKMLELTRDVLMKYLEYREGTPVG